MSTVYANPMGFTTKRPTDYPAIDHVALMRDAHRIAKASRSHFGSYREALAYGLQAAWLSAKSRRQIQSLATQAGRPAIPFTAAQIEASRAATRRCSASLWAS
ncbi:MAG: hypothetical protein ACLP19_18085 [Xanthobacteraceae bacterium]